MDEQKETSVGTVKLIDPMEQSASERRDTPAPKKSGRAPAKSESPLTRASRFLKGQDPRVECTAELDTNHPRGEAVVIKKAGDPRVVAYIPRPANGWGESSSLTFGYQGLLDSTLIAALGALRSHLGISERKVFSFLRY